MTNSEIFNKMYQLGFELARELDLPLMEINRINKRGKYAGLCHHNGKIEIYITPSSTMIERVKIQESTRTLCHELAHLRYHNHEPEFWKFQAEICELASKKLNLFIPPEKSVRA